MFRGRFRTKLIAHPVLYLPEMKLPWIRLLFWAVYKDWHHHLAVFLCLQDRHFRNRGVTQAVISMGATRVDCQYLDKLLVLKHALPNDVNLFRAPYSVRWRIPARRLVDLQYIHTVTDPRRLDDQPAKRSKTEPNVPRNRDSAPTQGLKHFKEVSVSVSLRQSQYSVHRLPKIVWHRFREQDWSLMELKCLHSNRYWLKRNDNFQKVVKRKTHQTWMILMAGKLV